MSQKQASDAIVAYLCERWNHLFRLTTVEQAMQALRIEPDVGLRRHVGDYLAAQPDLHPVLRRWGYRTLVLTEAEKLTARLLALWSPGVAWDESAAAALLHVDVPTVRQALVMLEATGLVERIPTEPAQPRLVSDVRQRVGPIGLMFHTVRLASGERFNVPCARDALMLVQGRHGDEVVHLADACAHCTRRLTVRFDHGAVAVATPETTVFFRGGG